MDSATLRELVGPIAGYDYVNDRFAGDDEQLAAHQTALLLQGGRTRRFHTVTTVKENTVAEHSWGVAALVYVLTGGKCEADLMMAALTHDLAEVFVGDVPGPTKRALGMSAMLDEYESAVLNTGRFDFALTTDELRVLKLADYLDGMMFCVRERALGNVGITRAYQRFSQYVIQLSPRGVEEAVRETIDRNWNKVNQ